MRSLSHLVVLILGLSPLAHAKICEADLTKVHDTIQSQQLVPVRIHTFLFIETFNPSDLRSRKADRIRQQLEAAKFTTAAFMDSDYGHQSAGDVLRSREEFNRLKANRERFRNVRFLLIDTFESFVHHPDPEVAAGYVAELQNLLSVRIREGRPTLLLLNDIGLIHQYLRADQLNLKN